MTFYFLLCELFFPSHHICIDLSPCSSSQFILSSLYIM
uniref:Uncharacterized protein n=1 Tax=Nelumbo nucifera TaxID=4432 RepID=A0A822YR68_NELNU|nr:TPA_asm: hypothetical protein HUJ06_012386 [Nelumbo nucifera]